MLELLQRPFLRQTHRQILPLLQNIARHQGAVHALASLNLGQRQHKIQNIKFSQCHAKSYQVVNQYETAMILETKYVRLDWLALCAPFDHDEL